MAFFEARTSKIVWFALVLFALSGYAMFQFLNVTDSPATAFPKSHPQSLIYKYLVDTRHWENILYLERANTSPAHGIENWGDLKAELLRDSNIAKVITPEDIMADLTAHLSPSQKSLVKYESLMYGALDGWLSRHDIYSRGILFIRSIAQADIKKTLQHITKICEDRDCFYAGELGVYYEYSSKVLNDIVGGLGISLCIVLSVLVWLSWHLKLRKRLLLILSIIWCPGLMLFVSAIFQVEISLVTSVFFAILVGLTGDNAIQFLYASEDLKTGLTKRATGSLIVSIVLITCSLCFLFMTVIPLNVLGLMLTVGFAANFIGDVWILNSRL